MNPERQLAEQGLSEALQALRSRIDDGTGMEHLIPFKNCLTALYELREWHRAPDKKDWDRKCDMDDRGRTLEGIIFARGLATHSRLANVTRTTGARPFTVGQSHVGGSDTVGGPGIEVYWLPLSELPRPKWPDDPRIDYYRERVEDRPLLEPMTEAFAFLQGQP